MNIQSDQRIDIHRYVTEKGRAARVAARTLARTDTLSKNDALQAIADNIRQSSENILAANQRDLNAARENNLASALLDRLALNADRVNAMSEGLQQIAALPDPVGEITDLRKRPSGIEVGKMRVPLGVIGIIYESRPNVTADAAGLCLKAGNACILRGGSEALESNLSIAACISKGLEQAGLDENCVQVFQIADREAVGELIRMKEYVDVIVPRGGKNLIERIDAEAGVPVIKHLEGLCHVYIDDKADLDKAKAIAYNAKARRFGICGAVETLLVAEPVAAKVLPGLAQQYTAKGIELRGCERTQGVVPDVKAASEDDWHTEYLDAILSIKIVADFDEAVNHISRYGSHHTDAIVTEDYSRARRFITEVDSSSVMVNASTQFADGFEYGLGAEIGISTDKLHVRGPVGLEGLTSQKYVVFGDGHIRP